MTEHGGEAGNRPDRQKHQVEASPPGRQDDGSGVAPPESTGRSVMTHKGNLPTGRSGAIAGPRRWSDPAKGGLRAPG